MSSPFRILAALALLPALAAPAHATFGSDVLVASVEPAFGAPNLDIAFTPDGVGYGAIGYGVATPLEIYVDMYRSTDDGESWQLFDTIGLLSDTPFGGVNDVHIAFSTAPGGQPAVVVTVGTNIPDAIYWAWASLANGNGARVAPGAYFLSIRVNGADIGRPRRVLIVR